MTQVFFYHGAADRLAAACALIGGAHAQKKALTIYAPQPELAGQIDRLLWTQSQLSFIPHCRADSPLAGETPILIADRLAGIAQNERLVNLSEEVPTGYERFGNLVEVVGQSPDERASARERVRFYKERGHEVRYFDLSQR